MNRMNLELDEKQAKLLHAAINAEMIKGAGTFLTDDEVISLGRMLDRLRANLNLQTYGFHKNEQDAN